MKHNEFSSKSRLGLVESSGLSIVDPAVLVTGESTVLLGYVFPIIFDVLFALKMNGTEG